MDTANTEIVTDKSAQRWITISIAFAAFMSKLDGSIVNISLPAISQYFNVGTGDVSWVMLSYLLIQTNTMLITGKLGDVIGLKKTFVIGYIVFIAGSLLCGFSPGITMLIISRCLQGIGGAMIITSGFAAIPKYLPDTIIGSAFGIAATGAALGLIVGAPLGGFITGLFSWHWIFLINIPIGIVAILLAQKVIPGKKAAARDAGTRRKGFDILGAGLSFFGLLALTYGLNRGQELGWGSVPIVGLFAASGVLLVAFYWREKRSSNPLMDLELFRNHNFMYANVAAFAAFMVLSGVNFLTPFYFEFAKGLNSQQVGMVFLCFSAVYVVIGPVAGRISDKVEPSHLCAAAMISGSLCMFTFAVTSEYQGLIFGIIFLIWFALSYGMFISPNNNQAMRLAPSEEQGIASGVFTTMTSLGLVFGVSVFETIFSESLPDNVSLEVIAQTRPHMMLAGFRHAFIAAGIVTFAAFLFSLFIREKRQA
jgi:EmrB/QacA subfamily drug resistance transporter